MLIIAFSGGTVRQITQSDRIALLTLKEAEIRNGDWTNPDDGKVLLADYVATWIEERPALRPNTVTAEAYWR